MTNYNVLKGTKMTASVIYQGVEEMLSKLVYLTDLSQVLSIISRPLSGAKTLGL